MIGYTTVGANDLPRAVWWRFAWGEALAKP